MAPLLATRGAGSSIAFGRSEVIGIYESIASSTLSATSSTITFSGIPGKYKDLQIRMVGRSSKTGSTDVVIMRFNDDSAANYSYKIVAQTGPGYPGPNADAAQSTSNDQSYAATNGYFASASTRSNFFSPALIDIFEYSKTDRLKVWNFRSSNTDSDPTLGNPQFSTVRQQFGGGYWDSTSAITKIDISCSVGSFIPNTVVSLYGIRG